MSCQKLQPRTELRSVPSIGCCMTHSSGPRLSVRLMLSCVPSLSHARLEPLGCCSTR
ncbi:hypothetical protein E2C01_089752 [Portunus trituberculatus]|uniref:Uncharacterized protein n=1 Tax=Portunus trituberculatus TaxID=210409 RepID=A0A5B7JNA2_PORTR|nr:hypothetical protein [Portunus trituberculatus]